ncbi:MAG: MBL fold metallo-hydrolase [Actinobacteria bacterium]|nr:MBL fold metallo-hydrolase [Actinomycetota bacterium]MDI6831453.1 rhodanese-like domain-containing protein [Actinomycetota bacterium]
MFLETVISPGLAHLSYILGDGGKAAVIDPRRDCDAYLRIAAREGCRITHIFETHRNEDYVVGSTALAAACGAEVFHGAQTAFGYGSGVSGGEAFELGSLLLSVLHTPGHTGESISLVLYDTAFSRQEPVGVFTGDTLFVGDVGRTDFFPGREEEMAGLLHESIFAKLLPLGDGVILYPGHGQGSICGGNLAAREFSTLGYERRHSPALRLEERDDFIARLTRRRLFMPAYFERVHALNQEGPPPLGALPSPLALDPAAFQDMASSGYVLEVRSKEAYAGAHLPGSLAIPLDKVSSYAGWYLEHGKPVCLVVDSPDDVETAVRHLVRLGLDDVPAFLAGGMLKWEVSGRPYGRMAAVHAAELVAMLDAEEDFFLLDVRAAEEYAGAHLPTAVNIHLGELPRRLGEVPRDRRVVTFCGSGERATIAASVLRMHGYEDAGACFGSMAACSALGCPLVLEE